MFKYFEQILKPTALPPEAGPALLGTPRALVKFYWHFVRQSPWLLVGLFVAGLAVALFDSMIPVFIGRVTGMVAAVKPTELISKDGWQLAGMAGIVLLLRPAAVFAQNLVTNQAIAPGMTNLIRWQNHFHVVRQAIGFFQNDFAGRIANRVMQAGPALRQSVVQATNAVWYIIVYGSTAIFLLARVDALLALPLVLWFCAYAVLLRLTIPKMRERSRAVSEMRSNVTGRVVDSYTNILTVKLFARAEDEDAFVREAVDEHTASYQRQMRFATVWSMALTLMNAAMFAGTAAVAVLAWRAGDVPLATVATALPLAWQIVNMSGWVAQSIGDIFENVGIVQDAMRSVAVPRLMADPPGAMPLDFIAGDIRFENVCFDYGRVRRAGEIGGVLRGLDLHIGAGERVGLIGRSGAGKSTLVNLLLKFHLAEAGRILIDGQDIAFIEQESLRAQIGMVTQDTSLLHRSIRENLAYGRPSASEAEIAAAASQAHALEFIEELEDWQGRRGFDAHVGERGVKLSGGQRQRIAIARVILKDAPILVLDEATSALDSEVESAIQEQLDALMRGRTVIAVAHRLSTIARMDRLAVMDQGRIIEEGSHAALLARGGVYASLWRRQSGGFLPESDQSPFGNSTPVTI